MNSVPKVTYVEANGTAYEIDVPAGVSIMQAAVNHMIPGIEGDCGGLCACGTCHVHVPAEWADHCGVSDQLEQDMLQFAFEVDATSRLSCQVAMTEVLAGLVVYMPERQY